MKLENWDGARLRTLAEVSEQLIVKLIELSQFCMG